MSSTPRQTHDEDPQADPQTHRDTDPVNDPDRADEVTDA